MREDDSYYHGFVPMRGHDWKAGPTGTLDGGRPESFPIAYLDGVFAPMKDRYNEMPQGVASLVRMNAQSSPGWTVISFWDRSGDKRAASNTSFVVVGNNWTFDQVVDHTRKQFPNIWKRVDDAGIIVRLIE